MANRDNAPVPHTCPLIDGAISYIESIDWNMDEKDERDLFDDGKKVIEILEKVRQANSALRDWGNDLYKEKDEIERDLDYATRKIIELEQEIKSINESQATD